MTSQHAPAFTPPELCWPNAKPLILDWIQKIPVIQEMQLSIISLDTGYCKATVPRTPEWTGSYNTFHGGLMAAAADTVACFAILPSLTMNAVPADERTMLNTFTEVLATTDMNIRYLLPCQTQLTIEARALRIGKTLCPVEAELFDEDNKLVAKASVTYIRLPNRG